MLQGQHQPTPKTLCTTHTYLPTTSNVYLINNHVRRHSPEKLLIASIVYFIVWSQHKITIHKIQAHTSIQSNELADALANKGSLKITITPIPHIHAAHTIPYKLAKPPLTTKLHMHHQNSTIPCAEGPHQAHNQAHPKILLHIKWINNNQIVRKLSNHTIGKPHNYICPNNTYSHISLRTKHGNSQKKKNLSLASHIHEPQLYSMP